MQPTTTDQAIPCRHHPLRHFTEALEADLIPVDLPLAGSVLFHRRAAAQLRAAFAAVEADGLLDRIKAFGGTVPHDPPSEPVTAHDFGLAFDLNPADNPVGDRSTIEFGRDGGLRELSEDGR